MMYAAYRGTSLLSKIIEWRTWSVYSHVSIILNREETIDFCNMMRELIPDYPMFTEESEVEAWQKGGVIHNKRWGIQHTPGTVVDLFEYKRPPTATEVISGLRFLTKQIGKKYDWAGALGFFWIARVFHVVHNLWKWFCSELAAEFGAVMCCPLSGEASYKMTPNDVAVSIVLKAKGSREVPKLMSDGVLH